MKNLDEDEIIKFYKETDVIWDSNDKWHFYTYQQIESAVKSIINEDTDNDIKIANVGSGGTNYNLNIDMYHSDIIDKNIKKYKNYVVASAESLPYEDKFFDITICVGSVINYCNADRVIFELSRITKTDGLILLEFESSYSFNFLFTKEYKSNLAKYDTSYKNDKEHKIWAYSPKYIMSLFNVNSLSVIEVRSFHILSAFMERLSDNDQFSGKFSKFDKILKYVPYFRNRAHNKIVLCRKL